jgi:chromosome segregation ATPase
MQDLNRDMNSIKELISGLSSKMEANNTSVGEMVSNLEAKITVELTDLKKTFTDEMKNLKQSNAELTKEVKDLRVKQDSDFKALNERSLALEASHNANVASVESLRTTVSNETIALHETKIRVQAVETDIESLKQDVAGFDDSSLQNYYTKEETDEYSHETNRTIEALQHKLASVEFSCHRSQQNSRKFNLEIDGLPMEIGDEPDKLEEVAIKIFAKMDVRCEPKDIEAIHRLPSKTGIKGTIVRLHRRKLRDDILQNKMKLKNLKDWQLDVPGLTETSAIYVKPNLCPYYKMLAFNCRLLKKNELIRATSVDDDGTVKIKTFDNETVKIQHETRLRKLFPHFRWFKFGAPEH